MNNVQREFPLYARLREDYRLTDALAVGTGLKADIRLLAVGTFLFQMHQKIFYRLQDRLLILKHRGR
jgi:hypothetical protein